jgi:hypothetical protein
MANRLMKTGSLAVIGAALSLSALLSAAPPATVADAAQLGDRDAVKALLKQAADVNAAQGDGMTALHWAAMKNDAELAQTLLYAGANVRATTRIGSYTPLLLAAKSGNAAVMEPLIANGADVKAATANGTTPLMFAAASGNTDAVKLLACSTRAQTSTRWRALEAERGDVRGRGCAPMSSPCLRSEAPTSRPLRSWWT